MSIINNLPLTWYPGKAVKKRFPSTTYGGGETMWVQITGISGTQLTGILDSHPDPLGTTLRAGDVVLVDPADILDVYERPEPA
jgi:hypothetical protein